MSRCTEGEMSGRVRDYGDRGRRGTFGNEVRERPSGEGEHLCGSLAEDETDEQVLLLANRHRTGQRAGLFSTQICMENGLSRRMGMGMEEGRDFGETERGYIEGRQPAQPTSCILCSLATSESRQVFPSGVRKI